jgi:hypothetical protein
MSAVQVGSKKRIERGWNGVPTNQQPQAFLYRPLFGRKNFAGTKARRSLIFWTILLSRL